MTKDELIERVAREICIGCGNAPNDEYEFHTPVWVLYEDAARAVVELMMPPPLAWVNHPTSRYPITRAICATGRTYYAGTDPRGVSYWHADDVSAEEADSIEAAQSAAQAHAEAAWIAQTRAAIVREVIEGRD